MNVYNSDMLQKRLAPDLRLYAASNCGLATQGSESLGLAAKVNTVKTLMYEDGLEKVYFHSGISLHFRPIVISYGFRINF